MTYGNKFKELIIKKYFSRKNIQIKYLLEYFNICRYTLYKWIKNKDVLQNKKNIKKRKRFGQVTDKMKEYIKEYVNERKQFQIKKLLKSISKKFQISISKQTVYNTLKEAKITNKRIKINHYPYKNEKLDNSKEELKKTMNSINNDYESIDESGIYLYTKNNYGWSVSGSECEIKGSNKIKKYSFIASISREKVTDFQLINGSFNAVSFNKFMRRVNKKSIKKKFMDNAKIHHAKLLDSNIKKNIIYNIPYCSKYNPIEMFFNSLKMFLNKTYISSLSNLKKLIKKFTTDITSNTLNNYFNKSAEYLNLKN